jgi:hypothetical protein
MNRPRILVCLVLLLGLAAAFPLDAAAEVVTGWQPPPEGAAKMFQGGSRIFAIGAQSGGAGGAAAVPTEGSADLQPAPGGTPIPNSRCAIVTGQCSGGSCVSYLNFYCKTGDCSGRKFC